MFASISTALGRYATRTHCLHTAYTDYTINDPRTALELTPDMLIDQ